MFRVQIDDRIRLMSSVLLLTDLGRENSKRRKRHEIRKQVEKYLHPFASHPCARVSRVLAARHWIDAFYSYSVMLGDPPRFEPNQRQDTLKSNELLNEFEDEYDYSSLLADFWSDADLPTLWRDARVSWDGVVTECEVELSGAGISKFMSGFFGSDLNSTSVFPNPLTPPMFGFAVSGPRSKHVVCGPPVHSLLSPFRVRYDNYAGLGPLVVHEMCHFEWDEILSKGSRIIENTAHLNDQTTWSGWFPQIYTSWGSRLCELTIQAIVCIYLEELGCQRWAQSELSSGANSHKPDLISHLFRSLRVYFSQRRLGSNTSLSEYLPTLERDLLSSRQC